MTKRSGIMIPDGAEGVPIEEAWKDTKIPDNLKGALVYTINGKQIVARQVKEDLD